MLFESVFFFLSFSLHQFDALRDVALDRHVVPLVPVEPLMYVHNKQDLCHFVAMTLKLRGNCARPTVSITEVNRLLISARQHAGLQMFARDSKMTSHKLRYLYANASFQQFARTDQCTNNFWIQQVLGHDDENLTTSLLYQTCRISTTEHEGTADRLARLESRVESLQHSVEDLQRQLATKEPAENKVCFEGARRSTLQLDKAQYTFLREDKSLRTFQKVLSLAKQQGFLFNRKSICEFFCCGNTTATGLMEDIISAVLSTEDGKTLSTDELQSILEREHALVVTRTLVRTLFKSKNE